MRELLERLEEATLVSKSSRGADGAKPLTPREQQRARQAAFKAGAYFESRKDKRSRGSFDGLFMWAMKHDHLPEMREHTHPSFWEWREWFKRGLIAHFNRKGGFPEEFDLYGADKALRRKG